MEAYTLRQRFIRKCEYMSIIINWIRGISIIIVYYHSLKCLGGTACEYYGHPSYDGHTNDDDDDCDDGYNNNNNNNNK